MRWKLLLGCSVVGAVAAMIGCSGSPTTEEAAGGEAAITENADDYERRITCIHHRRERTRASGQKLTRAFHLKTHGCLKGGMYVNPDLKQSLRVGIFGMKTTTEGEKADHKVWMRLTNINQPADDMLDLRGLALKVLGVPGAKVIPGDPLGGQDFLMNDTRVHFLNDPHDVVRASEITDGAKVDQRDLPIIEALKTRAQGQLSRPHTLLSNQYHSRAPFRLGDKLIIRYFVETCAARDGVIPTEPSPTADRQFGDATGEAPRTADHLTRDLTARAGADDGVCLLLRAQLRSSASVDSWLEDYISPWTETPVTMATIIFPKQDVAASEGVCESLQFSPFNSVAAHEPVGLMNKGRYHIYKASRAAAKKRESIQDYDCKEIFPDFDTRIGPPPSSADAGADADSDAAP